MNVHQLFTDLGRGRPFASADAVFILAFNTIMLNTDLHNPQVRLPGRQGYRPRPGTPTLPPASSQVTATPAWKCPGVRFQTR